jgi:hypothetical protein
MSGLFLLYELHPDAIKKSSSDNTLSGSLACQREAKFELLRNCIHISDYEFGPALRGVFYMARNWVLTRTKVDPAGIV